MVFCVLWGVILMLMLAGGCEGEEVKCAVADYILNHVQHVWKFDQVLSTVQRQIAAFCLRTTRYFSMETQDASTSATQGVERETMLNA